LLGFGEDNLGKNKKESASIKKNVDSYLSSDNGGNINIYGGKGASVDTVLKALEMYGNITFINTDGKETYSYPGLKEKVIKARENVAARRAAAEGWKTKGGKKAQRVGTSAGV
jgi:hypothetical protein